ncbi:MAG: tail fiber domain-containing protein [Flavobacteriales bacterium]|nr:tail fiber domain-containing protein [Flavobacteriales bacterium]
MRKVILFIVFVSLVQEAWTQAPQLINYQAVIRDASGHILEKKEITLQLAIHTEKAGGLYVYSEVHRVLTNRYGMVNLQIGGGEPTLGKLPEIDWTNGSYFLELGVDQNAGNNFRILGSTRFVSVPYALNAGNVSYKDTSAFNEIQWLSISGDTLRLSGGNEVILSDISKSDDNDTTNEIQVVSLVNNNLSLSKSGGSINLQPYLDNTDSQRLVLKNDTLFISNGNFIVLPSNLSLDNDSTNELQAISLLNDSLFFSKNGGVVGLKNYLDNTDTQQLAISGDTLSIHNGNQVMLPTNYDNDSTNEIQQIFLSNDTLFLTNSNFVPLNKFNEDSTRIADRDGNTRVEVEANPNENIIRFKMDGVQYLALDSGRIEVYNTGSSVFLGEEAGLNDDRSFNDNVFLGNRAGKGNTGGIKNTAIGKEAMLNTTTGSSNTAVGSGAMNNNTVGYYNVAIGRNSLYSNVISYSNIAIGFNALHDHITNGGNIAIGEQTLEHNISGSKNVAIGFKSLDTNSTGTENVAIGGESMKDNLTGSENVAIGFRAGYSSMGDKNIFIGNYARADSGTSYSNSISIGYYSKNTASNQVRIGNSMSTSIGGQVGWTTISDGRYKENLKNDVAGLDFILELEPVTYNLNTEMLYEGLQGKDDDELSEFEVTSRNAKGKIVQSGFVAQDVERAAKKVGYDFSGVDAPKSKNDIYGLRYAEFVVPLVKGMQEQQELIQKQQKLIEALSQRLEALEQK